MLTRRAARIYTTLFVAGIASLLPLDAFLHSVGLRLPARGATPRPLQCDVAAVWTGAAGPQLEDFIVEHSFLARGSSAIYNEIGHELFGRVPASMRIGEFDALFLRDRCDELTPELANAATTSCVARIAAAVAAIEHSGVQVLVVFVPDQARIYSDRIYARGAPPPLRRRFLSDVVAGLRARDVDALSLEAPLAALRARGRAPFYRDDHHWTSAGAEAAAHAIAARLRESGAIESLSPAVPRFTVDWRPESESSLLRKLGFRVASALDRRFFDPQPRARFRDGARASMKSDADAPKVAYIATSYGKWGSPEFLELALGARVLRLVDDGRGSQYGVARFLARRAQLDPSAQLEAVVWELPEYHLYELRDGAPSWDRIEIPFPSDPTDWHACDFSLASARGLRVEAPATLRWQASDASVVLALEQPIRRCRIIVLAEHHARAMTLFAVDAREGRRFVLDDGVPSTHEFHFAAPRDRVSLRFEDATAQGWLRILRVEE
ncbi:MAG: alginate O-acetyltransferase AlgX-related protein [Planctomycetota bacterium]